MWKLPGKVIVTSGVGEGSTSLNAFDKALLGAGIGNLSLIRVTSVLPAQAKILRLKEMGRPLEVTPGTLVPAVYSYITSDTIGETIASAIAVGKPHNKEKNGMIFEVALAGDVVTARNVAEQMVRESLEARGLEVDEVVIEASQLVVKSGIGCVISAVLMLP